MSYIFAKILAKFMCLGKWAKTKRLIQPRGCLRVSVTYVSKKQKEGKTIQNTLEMLLQSRELSYDELAKRCGMTYNGIAKIAKQQNQSIQYATVEKITKTLNITANDLMGYFSLSQPQIEITDIYQLSEQNQEVFKAHWRIENYDLEMLFTVVLGQNSGGKNEVAFCIDDIKGSYSEDFLYSLFQVGKEAFQQTIEQSLKHMLGNKDQQKKNRYKVVFSVMKESLFFITYCDI